MWNVEVTCVLKRNEVLEELLLSGLPVLARMFHAVCVCARMCVFFPKKSSKLIYFASGPDDMFPVLIFVFRAIHRVI